MAQNLNHVYGIAALLAVPLQRYEQGKETYLITFKGGIVDNNVA
jgi:hypothetical protein